MGRESDDVVILNYFGKVNVENINLSKEGVDFLRAILTVDPKERLSAQEALNHCWFIKYNLLVRPKIPQVTTMKFSWKNLESSLASLSPGSPQTPYVNNSPKLMSRLSTNSTLK